MGGKVLQLESERLWEGGKAEGKAEGENRVNQLNEYLISENRLDDLARAVKDRKYQAELYKEYGL